MNKFFLWLFNWRYGFKHGFDLAEYSRYVEYPLAFRELQFAPGSSLLDIGSGRFGKFPLYVSSHTNCTVHSTDAASYFKEQYGFAKKLGLAAKIGKALFIEQADATKLPYKNQSFDRVSSISVIEHIPDNGDLKAIREIARVLKKNGTAVLTFPYNPLKDDEKAYLFTHDSRFYKGNAGTTLYGKQANAERVFFARTYNESRLRELVKASGLALAKRIYFGEPSFPISRLLYDNNSRLFNLFAKYCLGIFTPLLAKMFFKEIPLTKFQHNDWQGVGICVVLEK